jgi:K+ transporter
MMMTTVLVTVIMLLIWQVNLVVVLCFITLFLGLELFFFSSVLGSAADGSWVLLVFAAVLYFVMYIWNYGTKLKYETEVKEKLPIDLLMQLGCNLGTVRAPGIGLLYNELVKGVPCNFRSLPQHITSNSFNDHFCLHQMGPSSCCPSV